MLKQRTLGVKKTSTAADKAKKKRTIKIVKAKAKNKTNAPNTKSSDAAIPTGMGLLASDIAITKSESWSLTQSIRQFVRQEVEEALMKTGSKREMSQASSKENIRKDEYVRLEDLVDIVNKLVSRNVVENIFETNAVQIQETAEKVQSLEDNLLNLTARMELVEESVSEMQKGLQTTSAATQRSAGGVDKSKSAIRFQLPEDEHPFLPSAMPRFGTASKTSLPIRQRNVPNKSSDDDSDDSEDLESHSSSWDAKKNKTCVYTELMNRLSRKTGGQQSAPHSDRSSIQKSDPDLQRRMTERHQYEANNMPWYKKSPLTLQVDNPKNPFTFPNELRDPGAGKKKVPGVLTQGPNQRLSHPRLARPGAPGSSEDGQSDWLFEQ